MEMKFLLPVKDDWPCTVFEVTPALIRGWVLTVRDFCSLVDFLLDRGETVLREPRRLTATGFEDDVELSSTLFTHLSVLRQTN